MSNQSGEHPNLQRRDFLRMLCGGSALLTMGEALSGCGGGNENTGSKGAILFTQSQPVTADPVTVTDAARGIQFDVPGGSFTQPTSVTVSVHSNPDPKATPKGFLSNQNAIDLLVDPYSMAPNGTLLVHLPWQNPYSVVGTVIYLSNVNGNPLPVTTSYDGNSKVLTGTITRADLVGLAASSSGFQSYSLFVSSINLTEVTKAVHSGQRSQSSSSRGPGTVGKRVAILVYGLFETPSATEPVKTYLESDRFKLFVDPAAAVDQNAVAATGKVYDIVDNNFQYDYFKPIRQNGEDLANYVRAAYSQAEIVDIYAHSLGGLVSRWAIERSSQPLGGRIRQLVTMGTPHNGVPLKGVQLLLWLVLPLLGGFALDGAAAYAPGAFDMIENSDFLKELNGQAPTFSNTAYRALAGTSFAKFQDGLTPGIGEAIDKLYRVINLGQIKHDGIVPEVSALALGFPTKSLPKRNHCELVSMVAVDRAIDDWVVASVTGTVK